MGGQGDAGSEGMGWLVGKGRTAAIHTLARSRVGLLLNSDGLMLAAAAAAVVLVQNVYGKPVLR